MALRRPRNIRRRGKEDSDEDDGGESHQTASVRERLEVAKVLQKQRSRNAGIDTGTLATQNDELQEVLAKVEAPAQNDMLDTFAKEEVIDEAEEDPNMHAYVEQQMEKRLGVKKGSDKQQGPLDPEQALFVTPEELKVEAIKPAEVAGSWLTGISEVQLSSQFKLKNIEETEAAKLRLLRPDRDSEDEDDDLEYAAQTVPNRLPRGAYPRGFGHENTKLGAVRKTNLVKKSDPAFHKKIQQKHR